MNILYLYFALFYLVGMLNGIVATVIIFKLFALKKYKMDIAAQEVIREQEQEMGLRDEHEN